MIWVAALIVLALVWPITDNTAQALWSTVKVLGAIGVWLLGVAIFLTMID